MTKVSLDSSQVTNSGHIASSAGDLAPFFPEKSLLAGQLVENLLLSKYCVSSDFINLAIMPHFQIPAINLVSRVL